jgi:parvulin-like peptidyl-prolyl isomerase
MTMRVLMFLVISGALWAQAPVAPTDRAAAKPSIRTGKPSAAPVGNSADPVVFTAGSTKITESEFEALMTNLPDSVRQQIGGEGPEARRRFAEQLGEVALYADEARRLKLDATPAAKAQLMLQEESLLAGLLYKHILEGNKPTEEACKAWFDAHRADSDQVTARQILIRFQGSRVPLKPNQQDSTEEAALTKITAIRGRIVAGEDFAVVAKSESDDPASGPKGGDLGTFGHGRLVPVLDEAAFTLPMGVVSQPLRSQFGWHLIQVQEHKVQNFTTVKAEIEKQLQTDDGKKAMQAFKNSTKLVLDETYFGKPALSKPPNSEQPGGTAK